MWRIGTLDYGKRSQPLFFARLINPNLEEIAKSLQKTKISRGLIIATAPNIPFHYSKVLSHEIISIRDCLVHDSKNFHIDKNIIKAAIGLKQKQQGFSSGYRTAVFSDVEYEFTKKQAAIIEALDKNGKMNKYELLAEADSEQYDLFRIFRDSKGRKHKAWDVLIKFDGKGSYWLDC